MERQYSRNALPARERLKLMKLVADVDKVRKMIEPSLSDVKKAVNRHNPLPSQFMQTQLIRHDPTRDKPLKHQVSTSTLLSNSDKRQSKSAAEIHRPLVHSKSFPASVMILAAPNSPEKQQKSIPLRKSKTRKKI